MKQGQCRLGLLLAIAGLLATGAWAATHTWTGSGPDNNWSSVDNWDAAGLPVSASNTTVRLAGNTRLKPVQDIATPFVLNRLDYVRAASGQTSDTALAPEGAPLRFVPDGTTQPRIWLDRWANCDLRNDIEIPQGVTLFADIGTWGVNLHGLISGEGGIDKLNGAGAIRLYHADNTFSGGLIIRADNVSWRQVHVNASGAMGTGPVSLYGGTINTNVANAGGLILNNTTTHTNTILLFADSPIHGRDTISLTGPINLGAYTLHLRGNGTTTASGVIAGSGEQALVKSDAGRWILAATNTFTGRVTVNNGALGFQVPDAWAPSIPLTLTGGTLELNGKNQTLAELAGAPGIRPACITTDAAAVLTVAQDTDTVFEGSLAGPLTLVKSGTGTLALGCTANTFGGGYAVSNGVLAVTASGALGTDSGLDLAGGKLHLGASDSIRRLFYDGVQQPRGTYGSTASDAQHKDDTRFTGTQVLAVIESPPVAFTSYVWDAGAGTDTALATAANWVDDVLPPFDGTALAVFGTDGTAATVTTATSLYGVSFDRDANFNVDGTAALTLGQGGLAAADRAAWRHYTVTTPLMLGDSQAWNIGANVIVQLSGTISDTPGVPPTLIKTGKGRVQLNAENTFAGPLTISNGTLRITNGGALGSTAGATTVRGDLGGKLLLSGTFTSDEPLILGGDLNNGGVLQLENGDVTLAGPVTVFENQTRIQTGGGKTLTFTGGITSGNDGLLVLNPNGGTMVFADKPIRISNKMFYFDQVGTCVVAATNNLWGETLVCGGTLRCDLPDALPPATALRLGVDRVPDGMLDLNGNDQTIGRLYVGTFKTGQRVVQSTTPATLTVHQNASDVLDVRFDGAVSLLKSGTGTLTLTNAFSTTSGGFSVTNGTLAVSNAGTFGPNCTNVTVLGNGTLALGHSTAIANKAAVVRMPSADVSSAKIDLAAGVDVQVGWLFYGDEKKPAGTYGASGSNAQNKDATHFTGTGKLTVLGDCSGTLMLLR